MKVRNCKKCKHHTVKRYSIRHVPASGKAVGYVYYYAFCEKHKDRCLNIKRCEECAGEIEDG